MLSPKALGKEGGDSSLPLPSFRGLQAILDVPGLVGASLRSLPPSSLGVTPVSLQIIFLLCVCLCVSSYKDTSHTGLRTCPTPL